MKQSFLEQCTWCVTSVLHVWYVQENNHNNAKEGHRDFCPYHTILQELCTHMGISAFIHNYSCCTSAAILYTGSLPSKVLRIFQTVNLNRGTMSLSTFFQLQSLSSACHKYCHQQILLSTLKYDNMKLQVGGDGKADSLGHSPKYGTYSLMELTCNRLIEFQLVQVLNTIWHF